MAATDTEAPVKERSVPKPEFTDAEAGARDDDLGVRIRHLNSWCVIASEAKQSRFTCA